LKIALVYDAIYPYVKGGGERIFCDLAKHLSRRHEVHLFGMKFWDGPAVQNPKPNIFIHGVCRAMQFYTHGNTSRRSIREALWFALCMLPALLKEPKFDIIDCMSTPYLPLFTTSAIAKIKGTPLVSSWLEIWREDHWDAHFQNRFLAKIGAQLEHRAAHIPLHILANSPHTAEGLKNCMVKPDKITVLTPWIDIEEVSRFVADSDSACDIIAIGRLIPSKRVDLLINALALMSAHGMNVRCHIIGSGPEEEGLKRLAAKRGLANNVLFLGWVANVIPYLKNSKILALLSEREGFGIVVIEAAACGVPTVTLDAPNNAAKDLVMASQCGSISANDPHAVADALQRLLEIQKGDACVNSEKLRSWAAEYDKRMILKRYEQTYLQIVRRYQM
jgi:glycosyltransferase involved in cell wall biosynthesis